LVFFVLPPYQMVSMGSSGLAPGTYDAKIKLEHDESAVLEVTGRRVWEDEGA
jgi:hypothetical protein